MDLDALKELARTAYKKEYIRKQPMGRVENTIFGIGLTLWVGGCCAVLGGLGMLAFGAAAAVPVLVGGVFGALLTLPVMAVAGSIGQDKALRALEQDIENGTLTARFQREILQQPSNDTGPPALAALTAKESFNNPGASAPGNAPSALPVKRPAGP